jgi:hypothetical protein
MDEIFMNEPEEENHQQMNLNMDEIILNEEGTQKQMVSNSKRTDPAWQFFEISKEKKEWNCVIKPCNLKFTYSTECPSAEVAKRHLKSKHHKKYKIIEEELKNKIFAAGPSKKKKNEKLIAQNNNNYNFYPTKNMRRIIKSKNILY